MTKPTSSLNLSLFLLKKKSVNKMIMSIMIFSLLLLPLGDYVSPGFSFVQKSKSLLRIS